ncbi:hypothetical protein ACTTZI_004202 [Vibrio vulnificus]
MRKRLFLILKRVGVLPSTVVDSSEIIELNNISLVLDEYRDIVATIGSRTDLLEIAWFQSNVISIGETLDNLNKLRESDDCN